MSNRIVIGVVYKNRKKLFTFTYDAVLWICQQLSGVACVVVQGNVVVSWFGLCCLSSCLYLVKAPLVPWSPWLESWWSQSIEFEDSNKSKYLKHQTDHSDYFDKLFMFNLHSVTVDSILPRMNSIMCIEPLLLARSINPTP